MDRFYELKGAKNTRDFYGLVNKDGKTIKTHNFIRSCALNKLTKDDKKKLCDVALIIDLRDADEVEEKPDDILASAKNVNMPVFTSATAGVSLGSKSIAALDHLPVMEDIYRKMVTEPACVDNLAKIMQAIINADGPVLWHCSEGKDRCGLVSVLFLSLLDVPEETIKEDYLATNLVPSKNKKRYYKLVLFATRDKKKADAILPFFEARESFLDAALTGIKDTYGTMDNFIKEGLHITDEMRASLQNKCF